MDNVIVHFHKKKKKKKTRVVIGFARDDFNVTKLERHEIEIGIDDFSI
jgi:hypothetical protein